MGLESVEIIVEIEHCFGIEISDSETVKMYTVGELTNHIWNSIEHKEVESCLTQILFFRLRKFFCQQFSFDYERFNPDTYISQFATKKTSKWLSDKLKDDLILNIPTLYTGGAILFFFESESDTILDLIDGIIRLNIKSLENAHGINQGVVHSVVASIIHEVLGVSRTDIVPTARFNEDLGL